MIRTVLINVLLLALLWTTVEVGFSLALKHRNEGANEPRQASDDTDEFGRRNVVNSKASLRPNVLIVAGCSFVFGDGVSREDTLPQILADKAPRYFVYNYGKPGGGPHSFLHGFKSSQVRPKAERAVMVYVMIDAHIARAVNTMWHFNRWGHDSPYFEVDGDDRVVYRGPAHQARPITAWFYRILGKSAALEYFNIDWPRIGARHVRYTARLIKEAEQVFRQTYPDGKFYVVTYYMPQAFNTIFKEEFSRWEIPYFFIGPMFNGHPEYFLSDDHPAGAGNRVVADFLVRELKLR